MARPRFRQKDGQKEVPLSYKPILIEEAQPSRRKQAQPTLIMNFGQMYAQRPGLPPIPGQFGFFGDPVLSPPSLRLAPPTDTTPPGDGFIEIHVQPSEDVPQPGHNRQKKINQWTRWQNKVIPNLVRPYLQFLAQSQSLSRLEDPTFLRCTCGGKPSKLPVIVLTFTYLKKHTLRLCKCLPTAAQQLISQGLFPCAPVKPSIAVDLRVLDFANRLFLHLPPNNTAWCNALEEFFLNLGWKLATKDSLRRRFENSLRWFITLKQEAAFSISNEIACVRPSVTGWINGVKVQDGHQSSILEGTSCPRVGGDDTELTSRVPPIRNAHEVNSAISFLTPFPQSHPQLQHDGVPTDVQFYPGTSSTSPPLGPHPLDTIYPVHHSTPSATQQDSQQLRKLKGQQRDGNSSANVPTSSLPLSSLQLPPLNVFPSSSNVGDAVPFPAEPIRRKRRHAEVSDSIPEVVPEAPFSNPFPDPQSRDRPSDYLRQRCPLCFGGEFPPRSLSGPHAIVCVDACFTQKRNKGERDPERVHPMSFFVPEQDVISMQEYVDHVRPPNASKPAHKGKKRAKANQDDESMDNDGYEGPIQVPTSVLNGCEASFTAANEQREKASTQFFDDTGLMAVLCRHDRVLWVVNMGSAGEKQHYVFALLEILFQHLPLNFRIGLLYDIGCQLHRSCIKWGFLDRYLDRLSFAVSVFHAFGHQWPCQIIYHPRKCKGFGLSDGEGCERFWHSISKLIPVLRVSGYHQRLHTLDSQIHQLDVKSIDHLAQWLLRRKRHCQVKLLAAEKLLEASLKLVEEELLEESEFDDAEDFLQDQWDKQIITQTQPLPRRSKTQGKSAVEEVMRLRNAYDVINFRVRDLEIQLSSSTSDPYVQAMAASEIQEARQRLAQVQGQLLAKQKRLGVQENQELRQLMDNPYINLRMNALALKTRLRDRLRLRKFELDRVERMVRKSANARKLQSHTESSVERRDPTIKQLARTYNSLCDQLLKLINTKRAPAGSVPPSKIPSEGLFSLDIDDEIWQDSGLTEDSVGDVPLWLGNNNVRSGIKALLERDRCLEEQSRLEHERRAMQIWFNEEWRVVNGALSSPLDEGSRYQIFLRKERLCSLYATWLSNAQQVSPGKHPLPPWGPSAEELLRAQVAATTPSYEEEHSVDDGDDGVTNNNHTEKDGNNNNDIDSDSDDVSDVDSKHGAEEDSADEFDEMVTALDMISMAYYAGETSRDDVLF